MSSWEPCRLTCCMQATSPAGIPARSPASAMMRTASAVARRAEGCGAMMQPLRAFTEMRTL